MTPDQIIGVAARYEERFKELNRAAPVRQSVTHRPTAHEQESHAYWMCQEIPKLLEGENGFEKANRWLGFIQGVLWSAGIYTVDEMREHNR